MSRSYDLIVFDWDGTLMDSEAKIVRCMLAAAADLDIAVPGEEAVRHIIGLGLGEALAALFPRCDTGIRARLAERYREHFLVHDQGAMPLFPGVETGLVALADRGFLLAVATGKARRGLERVLDDTATRRYFAATRCADETCSKPHPRMLEEILEVTGVEPGRALMVGDTVYDIAMARNAGLPALAVSYGVHTRESLLANGALACLDSFDAVCAWLR
jgi:phosphoglycolate phosphatase